MTEVAKNKGKKVETTENDSSLEDEFEEYLKEEIPESQSEISKLFQGRTTTSTL